MDGRVAEIVLDEMRQLPIRFPGVVLCDHILMADHIHLILQLDGRTPPLPRVIQAFKSITTIRTSRECVPSGKRLWQRGYYDHVIRDDDELLAIRRYIQENPLAEQIENLDASRPRS
jgi:REP element-mobilizing transposase RayT